MVQISLKPHLCLLSVALDVRLGRNTCMQAEAMAEATCITCPFPPNTITVQNNQLCPPAMSARRQVQRWPPCHQPQHQAQENLYHPEGACLPKSLTLLNTSTSDLGLGCAFALVCACTSRSFNSWLSSSMMGPGINKQ